MEELGNAVKASAGGIGGTTKTEIEGSDGGACLAVEIWGSHYSMSCSRSTPSCFN